MAGGVDAFFLLILAWIFPPVAVAFVSGCGADLCLNILLTCLGWLPGCIHAFWLVLRRAEANERYGYGNWTYAGMGEYHSRGPPPPPTQYTGPAPALVQAPSQGQAPPPPGPPPGQPYPAGTAPPPSQQAPVDQKQGGYTQPADQKYSYQAPPQVVPADQRAVEVTPRAPVDEKQTESTAQATAPPST